MDCAAGRCLGRHPRCSPRQHRNFLGVSSDHRKCGPLHPARSARVRRDVDYVARAMPWLRPLDEDALAGRAASRRAITIPLALFDGCLLAGGIGFLDGVFVGLPPRYEGAPIAAKAGAASLRLNGHGRVVDRQTWRRSVPLPGRDHHGRAGQLAVPTSGKS